MSEGKLREAGFRAGLSSLNSNTNLPSLIGLVDWFAGHDVRRMKAEIHQAKAEACYQRYDVNGNTDETFLAEDYCP